MADYDKEQKITWDEISPSLQARFTSIADQIETNMNHFDDLVNNYRLTIGYNPPLNPEANRDIWWDMNYDVVRFYMSKNNNGTNAWEYTRGAWYGGHSSDIKDEIIPAPSTAWSKMKSLVWVSNVAKNGSYTANGEEPRTMAWTVPATGYYRIRDVCNLYEYNAQRSYVHDGGAITVTVYKQPAGSQSTETVYNASYDSQTKYRSFNGLQYPEKVLNLNVKDRLSFRVTTTRNPNSTDSVEIYQIATISIYRNNFGDPNNSEIVDEW